MAKRLMTTTEIKATMSIAGEPDNIIEVMQDIISIIAARIDLTNIPSLDNMQFALEQIIADLHHWEKMERKRQSIN